MLIEYLSKCNIDTCLKLVQSDELVLKEFVLMYNEEYKKYFNKILNNLSCISSYIYDIRKTMLIKYLSYGLDIDKLILTHYQEIYYFINTIETKKDLDDNAKLILKYFMKIYDDRINTESKGYKLICEFVQFLQLHIKINDIIHIE